jgi:cysteine synthase A
MIDSRAWAAEAIRRLLDESGTCNDTPMHALALPAFANIRFLLKDESVHPTGSLKHRLARSLFLYALCSGRLRPGQAAVDASSGSTAISEAWFAQRLGVPFTAVMPRNTGLAKQHEVLALGGYCELVDAGTDCAVRARELAREQNACYLDQFGLAGSATDWRGNNNIAQSILEQCAALETGDPDWIVCGAGTGGTSATLGRYLRYRGSATQLCVADPLGSAFARAWSSGDSSAVATRPSDIEGIGRARVEPCFVLELADEVIEVPDAASIASVLALEAWTGHRFGGSSGTNLIAALQLADRMQGRGQAGSIVLLLCDRGERYADTLFDPDWRRARGHRIEPWREWLEQCAAVGSGAAPPRPAEGPETPHPRAA